MKDYSLLHILCDDYKDKKVKVIIIKNSNLINKLLNDYEVFNNTFNLKVNDIYEMFISDENKKKCLVEKHRSKKTLTMEDYIKK